MIILKMHASFGKLNGELCLKDGLNLLCLPNESGKSTWSAFLLAMLYGIDTSEKPSAANGRLPAKERYRPWDGRSMHGRIELEHNGRRITIERRTQGRVPMGVFEAYDTDTGSPIPELNAENCGRVLCGVERSVFERTAFIRQLGLAVTEDSALEKRMNALVTTGEEGISASELERELHERTVKLTRTPTGRIPQLKARMEDLRRELQHLQSMKEEALQLHAELEQAQQELSRLDALCKRIERAKNAKKHLALEELSQKHSAQELLCKRLQAQADKLPEEAELHRLKQALEQADSDLHTAQLEHAFAPEAPRRPIVPTCFVGVSAAQAAEQQAADAERHRRLTQMSEPKKTSIFLALAVALLATALCFVSLPIGLGATVVGCIFFLCAILVYKKRSRAFRASRHEAEQILERYGVNHIDKTAVLVQDYRTSEQAYFEELSAHNERKRACSEQLRSSEAKLEAVIRIIRTFAPNCETAVQAKEAVQAALRLRGHLVSEVRTLELQRSQLLSMQQLFGSVAEHSFDPEVLSMDEVKLNYEKNIAAQRVSEISVRLGEQHGRIAATGDATAVQAELEQTQQALSEAMRLVHVLQIAIAALQNADEALRARFSPQITAEAASILSALTNGKYTNLLLKPDMQLSVREATDPVMHSAAAMSCGTADQMYLALRLAMVHRLLPENTPIVLDDALVNFDDRRCAAALSLLSKENRQIILFSCKEIAHVL